MRILIFVLALLLTPIRSLAAQEIALDVNVLDISTERGSHNSVIATAQDSQGYIWLASIRGIYVYDGREVRRVLEDVLQDTKIRDMHMDKDDTLWVGTNSGVLAYSLHSGTPRWYETNDTPAGRSTKSVNVLYADQKGSLWAGTVNGGLHRYEPSFDRFDMVDIVPPNPDAQWSVFDITESPKRDMWLATKQGVLRLTGSKGPGTKIPLSTGEEYTAKALAFDGDDNLWVGIAGKGLWTLPAQASKNELVAVTDLPADHILDLFTDSRGDVWISTTQGLFRYACREGSIFQHPFRIPESGGKPPVFITSIMETKTETLWIGTFNHGALHRPAYPGAKLLQLRIKGQETPLQDANIISTVSQADSRIYVAPQDGKLYRTKPLDANQLALSTSIELELFLDTPRVRSLTWTPDNTLVCGMQNAVLSVSQDLETQRIQPVTQSPDPSLLNNFVRHATTTGDGRIWFTNLTQAYSWKPGEAAARKEMDLTSNPGGGCISRSGQDIWLGYGTTVTKINTASGQKSSFPLPESALVEGENNIKSLLVINAQELILGTTRQLYRFNLGANTLTPLYTRNGEPISAVLSLWPDNSGNIWMHTASKILVLSPGANHVSEMAIGAGHPASSITSAPATLGRMIVYGHSDGLLLIEPQKLLSRPPTRPKISDVRIFGNSVPATPLGRMPASLDLDHLQNYLTFSFSIPETSALTAPRYVYKLDGLDASWNDVGTQLSVSYAHLQPGHYVFRLRDGADGAVTESMSIVIQPPWWLTPWAKAGYAVALLFTFLISSHLFARLQTTRIRKDMLENLVMQDPLTGVPNRRKFQEVLAAEKSRCKRSNHQISVLMIDIDYFKGFNDRFGHQAGDMALKSVAQTLSATLRRPEDFVGRYGGEEFVVVLPSTNRVGAERVAQKIQQALFMANIPYPGSPLSDRITVSLGISTFSPQTDLHIDSGLFSADQALYQAKRNGRNCFFYKDHCLALTPLRQ
jgi:diguanylate cyclase (GGDEF)-like protein